jgi:hypothetical protein
LWDYLIKNGFVVDGTGAPWYKADVAIAGDSETLDNQFSNVSLRHNT